jgi:hypothetical protein
MIPTVILLDLALGRWWRLAPVTAAIGWPVHPATVAPQPARTFQLEDSRVCRGWREAGTEPAAAGAPSTDGPFEAESTTKRRVRMSRQAVFTFGHVTCGDSLRPLTVGQRRLGRKWRLLKVTPEMTLTEAASTLDLSVFRMWRLCTAGAIPSWRAEGRILIRPEAVSAFARCFPTAA